MPADMAANMISSAAIVDAGLQHNGQINATFGIKTGPYAAIQLLKKLKHTIRKANLA
jgi:hypothetical protein